VRARRYESKKIRRKGRKRERNKKESKKERKEKARGLQHRQEGDLTG
jgi:hypothetical protein